MSCLGHSKLIICFSSPTQVIIHAGGWAVPEVLINFVTTVDLPCKYSTSTPRSRRIVSQAGNAVWLKTNQCMRHMFNTNWHGWKWMQVANSVWWETNNWFGVALPTTSSIVLKWLSRFSYSYFNERKYHIFQQSVRQEPGGLPSPSVHKLLLTMLVFLVLPR